MSFELHGDGRLTIGIRLSDWRSDINQQRWRWSPKWQGMTERTGLHPKTARCCYRSVPELAVNGWFLKPQPDGCGFHQQRYPNASVCSVSWSSQSYEQFLQLSWDWFSPNALWEWNLQIFTIPIWGRLTMPKSSISMPVCRTNLLHLGVWSDLGGSNTMISKGTRISNPFWEWWKQHKIM